MAVATEPYVDPPTHVVQFYAREDELAGAVAPWLADAVTSGVMSSGRAAGGTSGAPVPRRHAATVGQQRARRRVRRSPG
jgi:hypothetical protein